MRLTAGIVLSLMTGTAFAYAADVTGTVQLPNKKVAGSAVVYLEGSKKATPLSKYVIDQREKMFSPHVSVITTGTSVEFPNNDNVFHNVFAYFNAKKFDLGMYPRGKSKTEKFDKAGVVALFCNVHSEMSAYIVVVDTPYYAIADKKGKFAVKDVPPGTYTMHTWHESGAVSEQKITVGANTSANIVLAKK